MKRSLSRQFSGLHYTAKRDAYTLTLIHVKDPNPLILERRENDL